MGDRGRKLKTRQRKGERLSKREIKRNLNVKKLIKGKRESECVYVCV